MRVFSRNSIVRCLVAALHAAIGPTLAVLVLAAFSQTAWAKITTTTAVTATSVFGQVLVLTARVKPHPAGSRILRGTVTFSGPGGLNETVAITGIRPGQFGEVSITSSAPTHGTVTATYSGDSLHNPSRGTVEVVRAQSSYGTDLTMFGAAAAILGGAAIPKIRRSQRDSQSSNISDGDCRVA